MKPLSGSIGMILSLSLVFVFGGVALGNERLENTLRSLQDPSIQIRRQTAYDLGEHKNDQAIPALIQALQDEDAHVRRIAARALGKIGNTEAVMPLVELLCQPCQAYHVKGTVVWALGQIGDPRAERILEHLAEHEQGVLQTKAEATLGRLKTSARVGQLIPRRWAVQGDE